MTDLYVPILGFVVALLATKGLISWGPRFGMVDVPNARSAHQESVVTGGGVAIVLATFLSLLPSVIGGGAIHWSIVPAVILLAFVQDERVAMVWWVKLIIQALVAAVVVGLLFRDSGVSFYVPVIALFMLMYTQNAYNFMDGLDGLSGIQGGMIGMFLFALVSPASPDLGIICLAVATASIGFVVWNLPPARIFMGDVGAHFLGLIFGWVALLAPRAGVPTKIAILPLGVILFDTAYTIIRRLLRKERIVQAHRFHLYQRLQETGLTAGQVGGVYAIWTGLFGATALAIQNDVFSNALISLTCLFTLFITITTELRSGRTTNS